MFSNRVDTGVRSSSECVGAHNLADNILSIFSDILSNYQASVDKEIFAQEKFWQQTASNIEAINARIF